MADFGQTKYIKTQRTVCQTTHYSCKMLKVLKSMAVDVIGTDRTAIMINLSVAGATQMVGTAIC